MYVCGACLVFLVITLKQEGPLKVAGEAHNKQANLSKLLDWTTSDSSFLYLPRLILFLAANEHLEKVYGFWKQARAHYDTFRAI